jgi:hypothetical protein
VLTWLIEVHPKIYLRARFDLTYDLSRRLLAAADSNGFYKALDLHLDGHHCLALHHGFRGDGDGI